MTRSAIISQEMVRIEEIEEQLRELQEMTQRNSGESKDLKEEVRKNSKCAQDNNVIQKELRSYMVSMRAEKLAKKKNKEAGSSSEEGIGPGNHVNPSINQGDDRGLLPKSQL